MAEYSFKYIQKFVLFDAENKKILMRSHKEDHEENEFYTFPGGIVQSDEDYVPNSLKRIKIKEFGEDAKIKVYGPLSSDFVFKEDDGTMIISRFYSEYIEGEFHFNEKYTYRWFDLDEFKSFERKVYNGLHAINTLLSIKDKFDEDEFLEI